jgi:beta-glucanase (GH16 family)
MKITLLIILQFILLPFCISSQSFVDPETLVGTLPDNESIGSGWSLDFSDEFNGTEVDTVKWTINNSTKTRTPRPKIKVDKWFWRPENVEVRDGNLVLKVKKENSNTMHCGSINSEDKYMTQYGYFEARIQIADASKGTHTAFWLQGPNMGNVNGNGNDGAEIDIFESAWVGEHTSSVIHIDGYGQGANSSTKQYSTPGIHKGFHTWGMLWTKDYIKIYYDGVFKVQYTGNVWIPHCDEYLWLSDGASFGIQGDRFFVDQPLGWLTEAYVDYIRVWKLTGEVPEVPDNLLQNGTFSSNGSNWNKNNSDISFDSETDVAISGITCRMPGAAKGREISQNINVVSGKTYQFSFKDVYIMPQEHQVLL